MSRYRVRIETRNDGNVIYIPQGKSFLFWGSYRKEFGTGRLCTFDSIEEALNLIDDQHGRKVKTVEFKYINK